ncbi:GIN domain-containing protein [Alteriqipengyuania sp. 357]
MIRKLTLSLLALPLIACAADAHGQPKPTASPQSAEKVGGVLTLDGFDTIRLSSCDEATVRPGASFVVTVRGTQRDLAVLEAETHGTRLTLDRKKGGCKDGYVPIAIEITLPALREIELSGATRMAIERFSGPRFEAELSGASALDLTGLEIGEAELHLSGASELRATSITADTVALDLSGASEANIAGAAQVVAIGSSGASEADTRDLLAPQVTATASGTASIRAHASRTAALSASGVSSIRVTGGATCTLSKGGEASASCD